MSTLSRSDSRRGPLGRRPLRARSGSLSDEELVARIHAGHSDALGELFDRYGTRAYRVAYSVCRDPGWAEDAVQNAFVSIWKSRATYHQQRGSVAAWLLSTVRYRAIDVIRANANAMSEATLDASHDPTSGPDAVTDAVIANAEEETLRGLISRLPDPQREVVTLAFYGGLSHSEIAAHLDLAPGTVKGRMRLALEKLREQIQAHEGSARRAALARTSQPATDQEPTP